MTITTVAASKATQQQLRAAAALLGISVAALLERMANGAGPAGGENIVDWAQRLADANKKTGA